MALNFNQYAAEGNRFMKEYTKQMGFGKDTDKAGRILSSILHALREIIPVEESLQFIAQLPMFIKAVYVNGWSIKKKKQKIKHMADFIDLSESMMARLLSTILNIVMKLQKNTSMSLLFIYVNMYHLGRWKIYEIAFPKT